MGKVVFAREMIKDCVSIIVPIYNGENYLERCIKSILNQTYKNIQLVLVDNYSTDHSYEICQKYAQKDERVIVGRQDIRWVSAVRNRGIELADGEYCCFSDQDDEYRPDMVETLYKMMQQENVDIASCNYTKVRENGELKTDHRLVKGDYLTLSDADKLKFILDCILEVKVGFLVWNKMFRMQIIKEHNITFEEHLRICEDLGFLVNYACYARRTVATDEIMYYWYQYTTSASEFERSGAICLNDFTYAFEHVYQNIRKNNAVKMIRKYFYIIFIKAMDFQYRKDVNSAAIESHKEIVLRDFYFAQLEKVIMHPIVLKKCLGKDMAKLLWKRSIYHCLKSRGK